MLRRKRFQQLAQIRVVGVGKGGITAVNAMIEAGVQGVDFITVDGNERDLKASRAPVSMCMGSSGGASDLASPQKQLRNALCGSDMVFIVGGLGGATGTRLALAAGRAAREEGTLATAIVTTPFFFEGAVRAQQAQQGIAQLREVTNTLIVIPNDRLLAIAGGALAFHQTYDLALKIWRQSVQGISELVNAPGLVNVDFADVRTIMSDGGPAIIAIGRGRGPDRARIAAEQATNAPYLDVSIDGAKGVLFNLSGGPDMTLHEVRQAAATIRQRADPDVNLIFGAAVDPTLEGELRMTLIATGCGFTPAERFVTGAVALSGAKVPSTSVIGKQ